MTNPTHVRFLESFLIIMLTPSYRGDSTLSSMILIGAVRTCYVIENAISAVQ